MHGQGTQGMVGRSAPAQVEQPVLVGQVQGVMKSIDEMKMLASSLEQAADRLKGEPQDASAGMPVAPEGGSLENRLTRVQVELNEVLARLRHVAQRFDKAV